MINVLYSFERGSELQYNMFILTSNHATLYMSLLSLYPEIRPKFSGSHTFSLTASAKIGPDPNSFTFVLVTARFWP